MTNYWKKHNSLLYLDPPEINYSESIAGFDIDWTIIRTKSGKIFPIDNVTDWQLWCPEIYNKLHDLIKQNYRIVFFTNQEGITKGKVTEEEFTTKLENIIDSLKLTNKITVLASLKKDIYRKPNTGMWQFLCNHLCTEIKPDITKCIYIGDAAGRPKSGKRKKDFSSVDIKFAHNIKERR